MSFYWDLAAAYCPLFFLNTVILSSYRYMIGFYSKVCGNEVTLDLDLIKGVWGICMEQRETNEHSLTSLCSCGADSLRMIRSNFNDCPFI